MIRQIDFIVSKCRIWYDYVTCGIIANIYNTQTISYESKIHPTVSVLPYDTRFVQHFSYLIFPAKAVQLSLVVELISYPTKILRCVDCSNHNLDYHISGVTLCPYSVTTIGWQLKSSTRISRNQDSLMSTLSVWTKQLC